MQFVSCADKDASEGALIRWAWNGTTKLPVTARTFYDRPLGPAAV